MSATQPVLGDLFAPVILSMDSHVTQPERKRLSAQNQAVLDRLTHGPATNCELAAISLKYTGRISDLRAAGYAIGIVESDRKSGRVVYALEG